MRIAILKTDWKGSTGNPAITLPVVSIMICTFMVYGIDAPSFLIAYLNMFPSFNSFLQQEIWNNVCFEITYLWNNVCFLMTQKLSLITVPTYEFQTSCTDIPNSPWYDCKLFPKSPLIFSPLITGILHKSFSQCYFICLIFHFFDFCYFPASVFPFLPYSQDIFKLHFL